MLLRLLSIVILAFAVSGCATTQSKSEHEQMQSRVTELEKKLESKDAEIVDLQYEVKDLSSKVDAVKNTTSAAAASEEASTVTTTTVRSTDTSDIIRVNASPEKIQKALKAAGVYTGKVDGKIGAGTKAAIVEFQKAQGLKADGVLGRKTWDALKTYLK